MEPIPSPHSTTPTSVPADPADDGIERVLFVGYCFIVGVFLAWAPWDPSWERLSWLAPLGGLRLHLLDSWVRSAVCAFGVLHLVWAVHDLDLLRSRK